MSLNWNLRIVKRFGWLVCFSGVFPACITILVPQALGQVVQLPSFRHFSLQTTVDVPDGGTVDLGGGGYAAYGSVSRGLLFPSRAIGGMTGAHSASVTAQIIDLAAMDEAILNGRSGATGRLDESQKFRSGEAAQSDKARQFIRDYRTLNRPADSVDYRDWSRTLRSGEDRQPVDATMVTANVTHFLKKAEEAEKANRIQSSRVYYRMAWESMTPEMRQRYQQFLTDRSRWEKEQKATELTQQRKF